MMRKIITEKIVIPVSKFSLNKEKIIEEKIPKIISTTI